MWLWCRTRLSQKEKYYCNHIPYIHLKICLLKLMQTIQHILKPAGASIARVKNNVVKTSINWKKSYHEVENNEQVKQKYLLWQAATVKLLHLHPNAFKLKIRFYLVFSFCTVYGKCLHNVYYLWVSHNIILLFINSFIVP